MHSHFQVAAHEHFEGDDAVSIHHRTYALSTNSRGEALIEKLTNEFTGPLDGKRVLDIGSGWGGVCVAAGRRGAEAIGIEFGEAQIRLAKENAKDFPEANISFIQANAMDKVQMDRLGKFDLITCDNVIEHVESDERLISHISTALTDTGHVYLTAPNAFSTRQALEDCHYKMFGITLLDRHDAQQFFNASGRDGLYDVTDYYAYDHYISLFERHGLTVSQLVPIDYSASFISDLRASVASIKQKAVQIPDHAEKLKLVLPHYIDRIETLLQRYDNDSPILAQRRELVTHLHRNYWLEVWFFVGTPAISK